MASGIQPDDGEFIRKKLDEIEDDLIDDAQQELGNRVDLSQGSPIKQLLDVIAFEHDYVWKVLEDTYYSAYYSDAHGVQLDKILSLAGMARLPRQSATGEVTFSTNQANPDRVVIPAGTIVATDPTTDRPSIPFKTTEPAVLPAGDSQIDEVPIRALAPWEADIDEDWLGKHTNVAANAITRIRTPINGVEDVTNPFPTGAGSDDTTYIRGRDRETDHEFRQRYEETLGEAGAASVDAIRANLLETNGVEAADVVENTTMDDNTDGHLADVPQIPAKSFKATVLGGTDDDVAQTIYETRAAGISSYGDYQGQAVGDDGRARTEFFDRASYQDVYVRVFVTVSDSFPTDGTKQIENAVIRYIGGETADNDVYDGTDMGEDVIYDLVTKAVMSVDGAWQCDVGIGTTQDVLALDAASLSESDISIDAWTVARSAPDMIQITTSTGEIP